MKSEALLIGRIFDDRGNRMTPSHARKRGIKYRYYLSSALAQGQAEQAGSIRRVPAAEIEALVVNVGPGAPQTNRTDIDDRELINTHVVRVEVQSDRLVIELAKPKGDAIQAASKPTTRTSKCRGSKTPSTRRREILVPESDAASRCPPNPIRDPRDPGRIDCAGRRWLDELTTDPAANTESIAAREGCSVRKVNMTISLAFLAPDLVKAAIEGRLPHGMGVARLCDLPAEWSRQHQMLGLAPSIKRRLVEPVSAYGGLCCRETGFRGQRQRRRNGLPNPYWPLCRD